MNRSVRLLRIPSSWLPLSLLLVAACADGSNVVSMTVFVNGNSFATLEYTLTCDGDEGSKTNEGELQEQATAVASEAVGPSDVWRGGVDVEPGQCSVWLRGRDMGGQVVCSASEDLTIGQDVHEVFVNMSCFSGCPTIDLPSVDSARKTSCGPVAGVVLSAELPADVEGVAGVRYVLEGTEGLFLDGPLLYEGTLEEAGTGTADFGEGPVTTQVWRATVGVIEAMSYSLQLTAFGDDGEPMCRAENPVQVTEGKVHHAYIVMPCAQ